MAGLFGKKTPTDKTVLIVDVENGSVGSALVRLSESKPPRLFAETRVSFSPLSTRTAETLLKETDKALRNALHQTSTVAARMRNHSKLAPVGTISAVSIFVASPWALPSVKGSGLEWTIEKALMEEVRKAVLDTFGRVSMEFHASGLASAHATTHLFEHSPALLLCTVHGEMSELAVVDRGNMLAHATMPFGTNLFLRTLRTHGGLSPAESHSLLKLSRIARTETPAEEALFASSREFASAFTSAAKPLVTHAPVGGILVIAREPAGEWVAQNLARSDLGDTFHIDTTVQALHTHHLAPHLAAHAARPDLTSMIHALFIGT